MSEGFGSTCPPAVSSPFQLGANALLFVGVNMYGVFVRLLAERSQRRAFLQARACVEDRLRLEDENEKQVGVAGLGPSSPSPASLRGEAQSFMFPSVWVVFLGGLTRGSRSGTRQ